MKTTEQFYNEILSSEQLKNGLATALKDNSLAEFLKENGVEGTAEEFKAFVLEKSNSAGALTDEQIETVAGGDIWGRLFSYDPEVFCGSE